jgi:hypothetical protein
MIFTCSFNAIISNTSTMLQNMLVLFNSKRHLTPTKRRQQKKYEGTSTDARNK